MSSDTLKNKVLDVIEKRKPIVSRIEHVERSLSELAILLSEIENYRKSMKENEKITSEQDESLSASARKVILQTEKVAQAIEQLKVRFSRDTLNIGVIGRARQGKSRLLQSITGLSGQEIPDGKRQHCTGVRSFICHRENMGTYADVYYYTQQEFINNVIRPYFMELDLGSPPSSVDQFLSLDLSNLCPAGAEHGAKFQHLKQYHDHADQYRSLLAQASPFRVEKERIPDYVAQHDPDNPDKRYFNHLAVQEVRIFCPFPNDSVGRIAVVDMPGLGDTGVGDEVRMVNALGQEIDLVLFVRMPKSSGDHWSDVDVKLYDIANKGLREIPIEKWSFQVINRLNDGSNAHNCEDLEKSIQDHHIRVVDVLTADCSDPSECNDRILVPILEHMTNTIMALDEQFAQSRKDVLDELRRECRKFLDDARKVLGIGSRVLSDNEHRLFRPLFDAFWKQITKEISSLIRELKNERDRGEDENFKKGLTEAIQKAEEEIHIPEEDEVNSLADEKGGYPMAYFYLLDTMRTHLTSHFQGLDADLSKTVEEAKGRVVTALRDAGLASLSPHTDSGFLSDITRLMVGDEDLKTLHCGFSDLAEFKLVYRGFVQHRIRRHLDPLTQNAPSHRDMDPEPESIIEKLHLLHKEALYNIQQSLEELLWEPSMAVFAIVEEFQDRVLRAEGVKERDWEYFMKDHKAEIWPSQFGWHAMLNKLAVFTSSDKLNF